MQKVSNAENETISIVVPVYAAERFISRCIDSILAQTYTDWELFLIDDGSPDRCGAICDAYEKKDSRIHVVHRENEGVSVTRNVGLSLCRGTYLTFVDADDYLVPHAFETLLSLMKEHHADIVMGGHYRTDPGNKISMESKWKPSDNSAKIRENMLLDILPSFPCGKLYRRKLWTGISFPSGHHMEDMHVMPEIFYRAENIYLTDEPLYYYSRENPESTMIGKDLSAYTRLRFDYFHAWEKRRETASAHAPQYETACIRRILHSAIRAYMLDWEKEALTPTEKQNIKDALAKYRTFPLPFAESVERTAILKNRTSLLSIFGSLQRFIVQKQQERRQKRRRAQ